MKQFTAEELATFDGKEGRSAYVAFKGVVYDVTDSAMWGEGDHEGMHFAGGDLTEEIAESGLKAKVTNLSDFFSEEFYETKKVVFVAAK